VLEKICFWRDRLTIIYHSIGAAILIPMMLLITADVVMRYIFSRPLLGSQDAVQTMTGMSIVFGLAYTAVVKGHTKVDAVTSHLPEKSKLILQGITDILSFGLLSLITWQSVVYAKEAFESSYVTSALFIPFYPFILVTTIGLLLFCFVTLTDFIVTVKGAVGK